MNLKGGNKMTANAKPQDQGVRAHGFLGSLKDALAAASRDETGAVKPPASNSSPQAASSAPSPAPAIAKPAPSPADAISPASPSPAAAQPPALPRAEDAARAVRQTVALKPREQREADAGDPPTTRVMRKPAADTRAPEPVSEPVRTQLVRGRQKLVRNNFSQDPVVGWLVVVGGPGLGAFRPIFEGNNTIGRASTQRIAVDFGDDAISSEEQAYIRYDSADRSFLFVPNLAKTNVVSVNDKRPTGAVELTHMDVITMGRTQLVFVPFCGTDFDWAELSEVKD